MNELFAKAEELAGHAKEYVNTKIEIAKLDIAEKSSRVVANLLAGIVVSVIFFLFFLFAGISGAFALSDWIGKTYSGFLIVAGIYLVIGILVWIGRTRIIQIPVMNAIIRQLFKNDNSDEED